MHFLAEKFNIPLEKTNFKPVKKDDYLQLNELALDFFKENLFASEEGQGGAGLPEQARHAKDTLERSPWVTLPTPGTAWPALGQKKAPPEKAVELGLLVSNEKNRTYDRFRGRIIFPIFSETGTILAFGGRTVFDDAAKYLNSPDTPIYKKGHHLFGFHLSKNHMKEEKAGMLVEGYLDMICLYQAGIRHVAASLGTALTEKQIHLLNRFCAAIHIFYDRDAAGETATIRNIEKMFEQNVNPRIVVIEGAKDPDEFVRTRGRQAMRDILASTEDGFKFLLNKAARDFDVPTRIKKERAWTWSWPAIGKMPDPIIRDDYLQRTGLFFQNFRRSSEAGAAAGQQPENPAAAPEDQSDGGKIPGSAAARPGNGSGDQGVFQRRTSGHAWPSATSSASCSPAMSVYGEIRFPEIYQRLSAAEKARLNDIFSQKTQASKGTFGDRKGHRHQHQQFSEKAGHEQDQAAEPGYRRRRKGKKQRQVSS